MTHYQESPLNKYAFNEFQDNDDMPIMVGGYPINHLINDNNAQVGGGDDRLKHLSVPVGLVMNDYSKDANLHGKYNQNLDQDSRNENNDPADDELFKKLFGKVERPKVEHKYKQSNTIKLREKTLSPTKVRKTKKHDKKHRT